MSTCVVHIVFGSRLSGEVVESLSFGDNKKPPMLNPVQSAVGGPASARRLDRMTPRALFQSQPFCDDSVSH